VNIALNEKEAEAEKNGPAQQSANQ